MNPNTTQRIARMLGMLMILALVVSFSLVTAVPAKTATPPAINHGTFGGAPYARQDADAVAAYKAEAASISGGEYVSDTEFHTMEAMLISFDGHNTYATDRGGSIYIQTVITGLVAGDIVEVDNDYLYDDGGGYSSYLDQEPYWIEIGDYTHTPGDTILNWLIYGENDGNGNFTLVIGSGMYNLAEHTDDLTAMIGHSFKLTRDVKVYQGNTLSNPTTSSRGYKTSTSEDTSVWSEPIATDSLSTPDLTYVGVDEAYVDDDWAGSDNGNIVDGHIFGQDAFATIQKGVNGAATGGKVNVAPGRYAEQVTIDKALSIVGPNAGNDPNTETRVEEAIIVYPTSPVMDPESEEYGLINAIADDISIDGFTLDGQALPDDAVGVNADESDLMVRNNIVKNFDRVGIWSSSYEKVDGSSDYNDYNSGIVIENNQLFSDSTDHYTAFSGIYIQGGTGTVQGNFVDDARRGIQIQPYNNPDPTEGVVRGNTVKAFKTPLWFNYTENESANWLFQDNIVEGIPWPVGLTKESWYGLLVETFYKGNVAFTGNTVHIGTTDSADVYMFGKVAPLGGNVDLDATYANNTFEKVVVITDGTKIIHDIFYTKIQDAINAANAGDTIHVAAGTYNEVLNIEKTLTLQGVAGAILSPDNTTPLLDQDLRRAAIYIDGVDGVTIDGFEIDGTAGDVHLGVYGFNSDNSTVRNMIIHDISNAIDPPVSDVAGIGIIFFGWDQGIDGALIENNTVHQTGRMGIWVGGMQANSPYNFLPAQDNIIQNNIVHNAWQGPTNDGGGAVQINGAKDSVIAENTIHDTGLGWYGVYLAGSMAGNEIKNNEVYNNPSGIVALSNMTSVEYGDNPPAAPLVSHNKIYANANYGLRNVDTDPAYQIDAGQNWWGDVTGPQHSTNPAGQGNVVSDHVDFVPWCANVDCSTLVEDFAGGTLDSEDPTLTLGEGLSVTYTDEGSLEVFLGSYDSIPAEDLEGFIGSDNTFFDIFVANSTNPAATLQVEFSLASAGQVLRWWENGAWKAVISNDGSVPVAGADGKLAVVFGPNSYPRLEDLSGTPFTTATADSLQVLFDFDQVVAGGTVTAQVLGSSASFEQVEIHLVYDPSRLSLQNVSIGGQSSEEPVIAEQTGVAGSIDLVFSLPQGQEPGTDILLATLEFVVGDQAGPTGLQLSEVNDTLFRDQSGKPTGFTANDSLMVTLDSVEIVSTHPYQLYLPLANR